MRGVFLWLAKEEDPTLNFESLCVGQGVAREHSSIQTPSGPAFQLQVGKDGAECPCDNHSSLSVHLYR